MRTKILYEDRDILVCHKPAGLAVQTDKTSQMDMASELKNYLKQSYLGVVHRLDQPVEGLLVFAKNKQAAAGLSKQLTNGGLHKHYYAVCCGKPAASKGELVDYLVKDGKTNMAKTVEPSDPQGKEAILDYEVKEIKNDKALLDVEIKTGRFHQIRAQLAHAGFPILGDLKYGNEKSINLSATEAVRNVQLYAYSLSFVHPGTRKKMEFKMDEIPAL